MLFGPFKKYGTEQSSNWMLYYLSNFLLQIYAVVIREVAIHYFIMEKMRRPLEFVSNASFDSSVKRRKKKKHVSCILMGKLHNVANAARNVFLLFSSFNT